MFWTMFKADILYVNSTLLIIVFPLTEEDNGHDRSADEGSDRVDRQGSLKARHAGNKVADQRKGGTTEHGGGQQHAVVTGTEERSR